MPRKYTLPDFLSGIVSQQPYVRWLGRKAATHRKRDKLRGNSKATIQTYKTAIHQAVLECGGRDEYTGEILNWGLISTYDNAKSKKMRRLYKASFALLPTVDHVGDGLGEANFKICGWRTNDMKNDLSHDELVELCKAVVAHSERSRQQREQQR